MDAFLDSISQIAQKLGSSSSHSDVGYLLTLLGNAVNGIGSLLRLHLQNNVDLTLSVAGSYESPYGITANIERGKQLHPFISAVNRCPHVWKHVVNEVTLTIGTHNTPA